MKKLFRNIFKKKIKTLPPNKGVVPPILRINPDSDKIHDVLGISDERNEALGGIVIDLLTELNDITLVTERLATICLHQNEFAYTMYLLSKAIHSPDMQLNRMMIELTKKNTK
jgi:hypothetical protein